MNRLQAGRRQALPDEWPEELRAWLAGSFGAPLSVERLGGMSGGAVWRARFDGASAIVKRSCSAVEPAVYRDLAPILRARGVGMPALCWSGSDWLVVEDIPKPLPRERWDADPEVVATLRRLHETPLDEVVLPLGRYVPAWSEEMTTAALSLLPGKAGGGLGDALDGARARAQRLFKPVALISGDPNPLNWGLREDGGLVLFDWERCALGDPALDLAITVPGLGDAASFRRVAAAYLGAQATDGVVAALTADICLGKVWSAVEFLSGVAARRVQPDFPLEPLLEALPGWLAVHCRAAADEQPA